MSAKVPRRKALVQRYVRRRWRIRPICIKPRHSGAYSGRRAGPAWLGSVYRSLSQMVYLGVIRFAYQLDAERHLTGSELSSLAERVVNTTDAVEAARVREAIVRGFYGQHQDA